MMGIFSVAIDGPSGAGKSTVARALAARTGALYLDTGAMYRAVGLYMLRAGVDPRDAAAVAQRVDGADVRVQYVDGLGQRVYLGREDVSEQIRQPQVSMAASAVSAVPAVRERMVDMQRQIARGHSVVMDGRDIGTKVLPDATLKVYLSADSAVRARRRYEELRAKGATDTYEQVLEEMKRRDYDDSTRAASPLCQADDAVFVDSTGMSEREVVEYVCALLSQKCEGGLK